jgi:Fic family protein
MKDILENIGGGSALETVPLLKALARANRALGEVKGAALSLPNQTILIDTIALQEALASSEIENIVTTQDEVFQVALEMQSKQSPEAKEVARYRTALKIGWDGMRAQQNIISCNHLIAMCQHLKQHATGFRTTPGTILRNQAAGQTVYEPPQDPEVIIRLMADLETFINQDDLCQLDPLIKMALIHHQFESIHPFPDGNGRIGRILNVLYLTRTGLLDQPILYLSRAINRTRPDYYRLLQAVREEAAWEEWVVYMLDCISTSAQSVLLLIEGIRELMAETKQEMRSTLPRLYSQDLINHLFRHPYTRIGFVQNDLKVSRLTARSYLKKLAAAGFVSERRSGRDNYYVMDRLVSLLAETSS